MEKIKCRVCGFEWTPTKEDHYIAREGMQAIVPVKEPVLYDAWDCPVCGVQFAVEGRKRALGDGLQGPIGIEVKFGGPGSVSIGGDHKNPYADLDARVQEECEGCKYEKRAGDEYPCSECCRAWDDEYEEATK